MLKSKIRWVQSPRPTHVPQPCNVRSSRTDHGKRSRVCFRLELGVAAPARGFTHAVPPRCRPYRRQLKTEAGDKNKFVPGIGQKDAGRGQNKIRGVLATRVESSGDAGQTLYMILEGRA